MLNFGKVSLIISSELRPWTFPKKSLDPHDPRRFLAPKNQSNRWERRCSQVVFVKYIYIYITIQNMSRIEKFRNEWT